MKLLHPNNGGRETKGQFFTTNRRGSKYWSTTAFLGLAYAHRSGLFWHAWKHPSLDASGARYRCTLRVKRQIEWRRTRLYKEAQHFFFANIRRMACDMKNLHEAQHLVYNSYYKSLNSSYHSNGSDNSLFSGGEGKKETKWARSNKRLRCLTTDIYPEPVVAKLISTLSWELEGSGHIYTSPYSDVVTALCFSTSWKY